MIARVRHPAIEERCDLRRQEREVQQAELGRADDRYAQLEVHDAKPAAEHAVEHWTRALLRLSVETLVVVDRSEAVASDERFLTEIQR